MAIVNSDRIDGWREIALYLGRDERTAKRWEKQRGMPVRRIPGEGRANVYVFRSEVDAWLAGHAQTSPGTVPGVPAEDRHPDRMDPHPTSSPAPDHLPAVDAAERQAGSSVVAGESEWQDPVSPVPGETQAGVLHPSAGRTPFSPSQHISLMVSLCGLLLLLAATAVRFFHLGRLESILFASESTAASRPPVVVRRTPEQEEQYLRAVYLCERRSAASLQEAQDLFKQAIARESKDAASYAGLAKTYLLLREYGTMPEPQAYGEAKTAAEQALALDPLEAEAHAALGFVNFFWERQPEAAEREFKLAMVTQEGSSLAHQWYGSMLMHQGRQTEALAEMTTAQQLNPTSTAILADKALALGFSGRRDEGVRLLESMERAGPGAAMVHRDLAYLSLIMPRDTGRFLSEARRYAELRQDTPTVAVFRAAETTFIADGETAMWRTVLREERISHPDAMHPSYLMAEAEAMLGHQDAALRTLERLSADRDGGMFGIVLEPAFASLHKDAAFTKMVATMGLLHPAQTVR